MAFINAVCVYVRPTRLYSTAAHSKQKSTRGNTLGIGRSLLPTIQAGLLAGGSPPSPPSSFLRDRPERQPEDSPFDILCSSLLYLWSRYNHVLKHYPLITKSISAAVLVLLSDVCAQVLTKSNDTWRLVRFFMYGLVLSGPSGHFWHLALDQVVKVGGTSGVLMKVALDQLAFAPVATALFFVFMKLAEGYTVADTKEYLKANLGKTMESSYKLWPLANLLNFAFIPCQHRVVFTSAVSVFWVSFLSVMSNR